MSSVEFTRVEPVKRQRRGLTLIEAAMVLAILALVVAGVMMFYQNASTNQKITSAASQVSSIQQAVRSMYAGQANYAGLQNSDIISALPKSMQVGTSDSLRNAFNGAIVVDSVANGSNADAAFTIAFSGLPSEACVRLAAVDIGRSALSIKIGSGSERQPPVSPGDAQSDCGSGNNSTITWKLL